MMKQYAVALAVSIGASAATLQAHHAIAAVYDSTRQVTLDAVVTQFQFINPHPQMIVESRGRDGSVEQWHLEMDNRSELAQVGVKRDTWTAGDRVVVTGSLSRTESHSLYVGRLERPADGLLYEQIGSSPHIRTISPR